MILLTKMMIVNLLGRRFGFSRYMELATPSTGSFYAKVDRGYFAHVSRMMYLTPFVFDDGLEVDFRSPDEDLTGVLEDCRALGHRMDICLVDAWHTYAAASRDLRAMFALLHDGGMLVVHDCLPETREGASPRFKRGAWWGQSYKAFLDFVLQTPGLDYFTLDSDHGCGVIVKGRLFDAVLGQSAPGWLPPRPDGDLVARWLAVGQDADTAFALFSAERSALMRLVPEDVFRAFFSEADIDQALVKPPEPPPEPPPSPPALPQPSRTVKIGWNKRVLRFLNRKLAELTG